MICDLSACLCPLLLPPSRPSTRPIATPPPLPSLQFPFPHHPASRFSCYASVVNEELHLALRAHMAPAVFLPATPRDCRRGQPAVSRKPVGAGGRGEARMELTVEGKGNSKVQDPMYAVLVEVILSRLKRQLFFTVQKVHAGAKESHHQVLR
ncbi:unnamed protein product [Closterium sp. NIES-64]|nr:unnamed protein product [Closterium sp. NIES-64]